MKKCPKCNKKYPDDKEYCVECGSKLKRSLSKYVLFVIGGIVLCLFVNNLIFGDSVKYEDSKKSDNWLNEYKQSPTTNDLSIKNWGAYHYYSSGYTHIEGTVKNTGTHTISYYKITAKYYNLRTNEVIDSDYTNSGEDLAPNESRKFEIMAKGNYSKNEIKLFVDEVH